VDIGCGNGNLARLLAATGLQIAGCDAEEAGVAMARAALPTATFKVLSVYDNPAELGLEQYDLAIATEVVEHLYLPRYLPKFAHALLKPGGYFLVTTPYYSYYKNLMLAIFNRWDAHHTVLWDGGHIKFWSRNTLARLLVEGGFRIIEFHRVGRISSLLWPNSMLMLAQKL
jgi:2-polyprenyl-3-methyl-5-hydroxy-6-metoxy-1,4-benzoquinol methylase